MTKLSKIFLTTASALSMAVVLAAPASATCRNCPPPKSGPIVINGNLSGFLTNKGVSSGGGGVVSETVKSAWQAAEITNNNGNQNFNVEMGLAMETIGIAQASGKHYAQSGEAVEGEFSLSLKIKK